MHGWLADENIILVTSTMAMNHVINLLLNQLGFVRGFKMGLLARAILLPPYLYSQNSILCNTSNG